MLEFCLSLPHFLHYSYATSAVAAPAKLCNMGRVMLIKELHPESFHTSPDPSCFKPGQIEKLPHVMMRTRVLTANPCVLVRRETYRKRVRGYRNVDHRHPGGRMQPSTFIQVLYLCTILRYSYVPCSHFMLLCRS